MDFLYIGLILFCMTLCASAQGDEFGGTPPLSIRCPSNQTREATPGLFFHQLTFPEPEVLHGTDVRFTQSPSFFEVGVTRVTFIARDAENNEERCSFFVNLAVPDNTPPSLICPANQTEYLSGEMTSINVTLPPPVQAIDSSGGQVTISYNPPPGQPFYLGVTEVTVTATDESANSDTCNFYVIIKPPLDKTAPDLICPPDQIKQVQPDGNCYLLVEYPDPIATDDSNEDVSIRTYPSSGSIFDICTYSDGIDILVTATDSSGNEATCTFNIAWSAYGPTTLSVATTRRPTTTTKATTTAATTTLQQTTTRPATTTKPPTTTRPPTTTMKPTTTRPATTTKQPTTTRPVTTTKPPTTTRPVTTTEPPTTTRPATTTKPPTTTRPATTTKPPTTTRPATTTKPPTTTPPATTTKPPTTTRPATTTRPQTTTRPPTTTKQPTTTRPATTTKPPTTTRPPTTTKPRTTTPSKTTMLPSTTRKPGTTTLPPTTRPSTTTKAPATTRPATTTKAPTTTRPPTTTKSPSTTKPSTTTKPPATTRPSTTTRKQTTSRPTTASSTTARKPITTLPAKSTRKPTTRKNPIFGFTEETDICSPNPCHNNGLCLRDETNSIYSCVCLHGYIGNRCDITLSTAVSSAPVTASPNRTSMSAIIAVVIGGLGLVLIIFVILTCIICSHSRERSRDTSKEVEGNRNPVFVLDALDDDKASLASEDLDDEEEDQYETAKNLLASVLRTDINDKEKSPGEIPLCLPVDTPATADDDYYEVTSVDSDHSYQSIDETKKQSVIIVANHVPESENGDIYENNVVIEEIINVDGLVRIPSTTSTVYSQMSVKLSNNRMNKRYNKRK